MTQLEVTNPATEQVIAAVPRAGVAEVDAAVQSAKDALPGWKALAPAERSALLRAIADRLESQLEDFAELESQNVGKPIAGARGEIAMAVATFRYFATAPELPIGDSIPAEGGLAVTVREPLGVVGLIVPWNFPLAIAAWKVAPALAAGNTIVLKPAELTPLTAIRLEQLAREAGLPEGVLNVVVGPGSVCGSRLVEHPDVAKIAFTGSTEVGRGIAERAAASIKRVTLELGGKSANIVFADADLEAAASSAPAAVFDNCGQDCCARSRILVERSALDEFLGYLKPAVENFKVGDPADPTTQMGPMVTAEQRDHVASYVPAGSPVVIQGKTPSGPGYWFPPTVLSPVDPTDRVATEEIFGPVVVVIPFDCEESAVRIANDSIYGLSGSIWTRDGAKALRVARAIESGNLSINSNSSVRVNTPFGGFKQSGIGRELGPDALDAYSDVKTIFIATG